MIKKLTFVLLAVVTLGLTGYLRSDAHYAAELVERHRLRTADDVFRYVMSAKQQVPQGAPVCYGRSFRTLIDEPTGGLWCDEGAIVMAVLAQQIGLNTRLVDMLHVQTGISHHTIVEIHSEGRWQAYDFTGRRPVVTPCESVDYPCKPAYRPYPEFKHQLLLHQQPLRWISQAWRSRAWPDACFAP